MEESPRANTDLATELRPFWTHAQFADAFARPSLSLLDRPIQAYSHGTLSSDLAVSAIRPEKNLDAAAWVSLQGATARIDRMSPQRCLTLKWRPAAQARFKRGRRPRGISIPNIVRSTEAGERDGRPISPCDTSKPESRIDACGPIAAAPTPHAICQCRPCRPLCP